MLPDVTDVPELVRRSAYERDDIRHIAFKPDLKLFRSIGTDRLVFRNNYDKGQAGALYGPFIFAWDMDIQQDFSVYVNVTVDKDYLYWTLMVQDKDDDSFLSPTAFGTEKLAPWTQWSTWVPQPVSESHLHRLRKWAHGRGLSIRVAQQEPENVVSILDDDYTTLFRKVSHDNADIASLYLINTLDRLGVTIP